MENTEKSILYRKLKGELKHELAEEYKRRLLGLRQFCQVENDDDKEDDFDLFSVAKATYNLLSDDNKNQKVFKDVDIQMHHIRTLSDAVRKAVFELNKNRFTVNDIYPMVQKMFPDAIKPSISAYLWKMANDDDPVLDVPVPGSGKSPSIYERKG